jgi:hypothetical protein
VDIELDRRERLLGRRRVWFSICQQLHECRVVGHELHEVGIRRRLEGLDDVPRLFEKRRQRLPARRAVDRLDEFVELVEQGTSVDDAAGE